MTLSLPTGLMDALGPDCLLSPERLPDYAVDGLIPKVVVQPESREAVSAVAEVGQ